VFLVSSTLLAGLQSQGLGSHPPLSLEALPVPIMRGWLSLLSWGSSPATALCGRLWLASTGSRELLAPSHGQLVAQTALE
jgi:hypothetical protein